MPREAWLFIKNETIRNYVVQAQKTWRKHNAAMILAMAPRTARATDRFNDRPTAAEDATLMRS